MQKTPISRANLSTQLYENLRSAIMDGRYHPGERLTISGIAEQFGTSSTPVREAIFRLVSERALEMKAATSVMVPKLTPRDLREIVSIRVELEGMAAYRVAETATAEQIAELEALNNTFSAAAAVDPEAASRYNRDFHFKILHLAEMPYIEAICESMWALMGPFLRTFHEEIPVRQLSAQNHWHFHFIAAVKAGDPAKARDAMREDVKWSNELVAAQEKREAEAQQRASAG